mgnify:CR=1 FL=1
MNYKGVIIEESLSNKDVLKDVTILSTKVEEVTEKHQTPHLKQWTLHRVEVDESRADEVANKISKSFDSEHSDWYADFENDKYHYIIYPDKIFKVDLAKPVLYEEAKQYGISLEIPEHQVSGFSTMNKKWIKETEK